MPRFFLESIDEADIRIEGADAHHIGYSLRMRPGEALTVCANNMDYHCTIRQITADTVYLDLVEAVPCAGEPRTAVTLFQALPKNDKFEFIVQKAIELGVTEIVPVLTCRCISRPKPADFQRRYARFQKIAQAAAKQSGRGILPAVLPLMTFEEAAARTAHFDRTLLLYENGGRRFQELSLDGVQRVALWVGSEGGFDPAEAQALTVQGAVPVWLGQRILRCETAPIVGLSILMHRLGEI